MNKSNKKLSHQHVNSEISKENATLDSSIEGINNIQQLIKNKTTESEHKLKKIIDQEIIKFNQKNVTKTFNYASIFISFIVGILVTFIILFVTISSNIKDNAINITANTTNIQTLKTTTTNQISTFKTTFTHDEHLLTQMLSYITDKKYLTTTTNKGIHHDSTKSPTNPNKK